MFKTFLKTFSKIRNIFYIFFLYIFVFIIFIISPTFSIYLEFLNLESFTFTLFWYFFWENTVFSFQTSLFWTNFLAVFIPFLISLNVVLFKELYQKQKKFIKGKSFFTSLSGMFFGFFGAGCAACSGLLFAPLISALGLSVFFEILPYGGQEFAYVGVLILFLSCLYILKKINNQMVCK